MAIRKIIVPFDGDDGGERVLTVALGLGRKFAAHVEAFHASVDPRDAIAFIGEGMTAAMIEQVMGAAESEGRERTARARARFQAACQAAQAPLTDLARPGQGPGLGFSAAFVARPGNEADLIAERGRIADLIVAARPVARARASSRTLEACLRDSGKPVLVPPPATSGADFGRRVAIAWNGSVEAGRAVAAAMPFLAAAERVAIKSADEGFQVGPGGGELVEYLSWHGISATHESLAATPFGTARALLAALETDGSDLLVMGAYTRGHMRRLIFGGVTAEVLAGAPVPVLMVH
jgi:nucleotide-binding universal stress UspA family protein